MYIHYILDGNRVCRLEEFGVNKFKYEGIIGGGGSPPGRDGQHLLAMAMAPSTVTHRQILGFQWTNF